MADWSVGGRNCNALGAQILAGALACTAFFSSLLLGVPFGRNRPPEVDQNQARVSPEGQCSLQFKPQRPFARFPKFG